MLDFEKMQAEVLEWTYSKGWEPAPNRTLGDEFSLIVSEISEALEAYRLWKFDDPTTALAIKNEAEFPKPEGVGSELADVLIRLAHYSATRKFIIDEDYPLPRPRTEMTFGDECMAMTVAIGDAYKAYQRGLYGTAFDNLSRMYAMLRYICKVHGFDLEFEYRRKMTYNQTRTYRHGGKAM